MKVSRRHGEREPEWQFRDSGRVGRSAETACLLEQHAQQRHLLRSHWSPLSLHVDHGNLFGLSEIWTNICLDTEEMERPPSQLENVRPSGLKQPSRLPAAMSNGTARTLQETSQSDINAKSVGAGSMMPPPHANGSIKHKISGCA